MKKSPKLESDRLLLQPWTMKDLDSFHQLNTDPFIRRFLWDDEVITYDLAREVMETNVKHFEESRFGLWQIFLKGDQVLAGYTGLWYFFDEDQPQLMYALLEEHTGNGYATEASKIVMEYAFAELGFKYVLAATDEPHQESQRVALRLGMKFVQRRIENGRPTLFYRIDKPDE